MGTTEEPVKNGCEGCVEFGEGDNVVCENKFHLMLDDTCLNQDQYSNYGKCEVVTWLTLKHGTVLQEDEN